MQGEHLGYLDGWRGLAIGFLLLGHFFPVPGINFGTFGVNLFFVLSGWLMTRLLFVQVTPIPVFYRRRISRIFPAHFLFIGTIVIVWWIFGQEIGWPEVASAALFVNNYFPGEPGHTVMPFGHIWSLAVEEHSYILLSAIAMASRRQWINPIRAIGFFCALFAVIGIWYSYKYSGAELSFGKWIHSEVSAYGIFASGYLMLLSRRTGIRRLPVILYTALALFAMAMHWWSVPDSVRTICGVGALALLVNLLPEAPQTIKAVLSFAPLRWLGTWSFSIYLWQQPLYLQSRTAGLSPWVALVIAIILGILSFFLVEKPVRDFLNRSWTART